MSALLLLSLSLLPVSAAKRPDWKLQWSDEFSGRRGALPDPRKWTHEIGRGDGGWGNNELQFYCGPDAPSPCDPKRPNAYQDGEGRLVIEARRSSDTWTSARLITEKKAEFLHGRLEARMKLPTGAGLWPAFWLLGNDLRTVDWPKCGEIDIMENVPEIGGNPLGPTRVRATLHAPGFWGEKGHGANYRFPNAGRVDDGFHVYGAIWTPNRVDFYVDDWSTIHFSARREDIPQGGEWVFEHPFFFILNLAVGGNWPGKPDESTPDPARVLVDYVRVYKASAR